MIPILINNRDRLTTTRQLVDACRRFAEAKAFVVDNASTYGPLLEWYQTEPCPVFRLPDNGGPRAAWRCLDQALAICRADDPVDIPFYVVTDSDLDLAGVPDDVIRELADGLTRHPWAIKAGLSLEINDLPEAYPWRQMVLDRESRFWLEPIDDGRWYRADIDTTFAMYRIAPPWGGGYGPALRAARPYTARHVPWYVDPNQRSDEETYYLEHLSPHGIFWSALAQEPFRKAA